MRASSISIPMHPRHCRHHLESCTSRHIATQESGEQIRTTEETKATAPAMQSGHKTRPRLPGRLFNFHIPSPVRSVAATPAGIARPPKAKDNMQPPLTMPNPPIQYIQSSVVALKQIESNSSLPPDTSRLDALRVVVVDLAAGRPRRARGAAAEADAAALAVLGRAARRD